jgi:hypothetical protein
VGAWRAAAIATELGFSVGLSILGGVLVGLALDRRLGTTPVLFLLGLATGLTFSFFLIYLIYRVQVQPRRPHARTVVRRSVPDRDDPRVRPETQPQADDGNPR